MRKIKKILTIKEEQMEFEDKTALRVDICNIHHTSVHYHTNSLELLYCLKGHVDILCNHEIVRIKPGEVFSIDYEDLHCVYSDSDNIVIQIHLDMNSLSISQQYLKNVYIACQDANCQAYQRKALSTIKNMILSIAYINAQDSLQNEKTLKIADLLVDVLLSNFDWFNYLDMYPNQNESLRQRTQQIIAYCTQHYTEKITISDMARLVNIDKNYFSQFMRKSPYGSFSSMLGYIRCYHAQYMILGTEYSISDISHRCGFSDEKYFYKFFHFWWNTTPTQLRQWFREYIKTPDSITPISKEEALKILGPLIAAHFVNDNIDSHL